MLSDSPTLTNSRASDWCVTAISRSLIPVWTVDIEWANWSRIRMRVGGRSVTSGNSKLVLFKFYVFLVGSCECYSRVYTVYIQ